jgi:hypothetical protein
MNSTLSAYAQRIKSIARTARSEAKLEGEVNQVLKECLAEFGISFDPFVNEALSSLGLSQVDSDRPDGVFGHIVYDYKVPHTLSGAVGVRNAKAQIEKYLDAVTNGGHERDPQDCRKWFGYVLDGHAILYCQSNGTQWMWSNRIEISEHSLLFLVHIYRSLRRKSLTSSLLSDAFGKHSDVAREAIRVLSAHLSKPRHKTNMLFREWKRLFEQVSTYNLEQLPSLKAWAGEIGIATKDASQILFAMHTYYSIVVKILTSELLVISSSSGVSVSEAIASAPTDEQLRAILQDLENSEYYNKVPDFKFP